MGFDPMGQIFDLKFFETRLESESLEPLIDYLALLGQKLWPKNLNFDKNIGSCLIRQIFVQPQLASRLSLRGIQTL